MRTAKVTVAALIGLASVACAAQVATKSSATKHSAACRPGMAIDQAGFLPIGGILQWVTIKGQDCTNPVVLMVHGGPGNPNTPFADRMFGSWTKDFTLVQWDQRGSGKTFAASPPAEGERLTIKRLTEDGLDVARYVTRHLGKQKVILMGGSWGSALAVHLAKANPNLFSAYVGTGQLVNFNAGLRASYSRTLSLARDAGDKDSVSKLEALGPPPWANPRAFGALRRVTRKYEALKVEPAPSSWFANPAAGYDTSAYEAAYSGGEDYSYVEFVGLNGDGIGRGIDVATLGTRFQMPIIMLQGEEDLVTPPDLSWAYFQSLSAPRKSFVRLPRTGHDPNKAMIDAQFRALTSLRAGAAAVD